jgi:hypothetical protein
MAPLPMRCLTEQVVRFPRAEPVRLTGPTELDLTVPDQAQFVVCDHAIAQDHRSVRRVILPMLGFKAVETAQGTLAGGEPMHRLKKDQLVGEVGAEGLTLAEQFYALAA